MEVVLLERIPRLGQMGDVVDVRPGFARNFLLPQGKALRANKANLERFERERAEIEARDLARKVEAEAVSERLADVSVILIRQAAETGNLYGSVTSRDIAAGLQADGVQIERSQLALERAIKVLGVHAVRVVLHPEVESSIRVNVARSPEEAELQAQGVSVAEIEAQAELDFDDEDVAADETHETDGAQPEEADGTEAPEGDV